MAFVSSEANEIQNDVPLDTGTETAHPDFAASFTNARLREAIRNNLVTFPSQTVSFRSRVDGDVQWRIAHLYFVSGWPVRRIGERYQLSKPAIQDVLSQWRHRAVAAGFVQEIQPLAARREEWVS